MSTSEAGASPTSLSRVTVDSDSSMPQLATRSWPVVARTAVTTPSKATPVAIATCVTAGPEAEPPAATPVSQW
jgi:hypothetical protein